jgi:hypothetical protein
MFCDTGTCGTSSSAALICASIFAFTASVLTREPFGLGEPARWQRVHLDQRQVRAKAALKGGVLWPGRRVDNPRKATCLRQPRLDLAQTRHTVLEPCRPPVTVAIHVTMVFRDVNSPSWQIAPQSPAGQRMRSIIIYPRPMLVIRTHRAGIRPGPWIAGGRSHSKAVPVGPTR